MTGGLEERSSVYRAWLIGTMEIGLAVQREKNGEKKRGEGRGDGSVAWSVISKVTT